ncbi:hypothetical protein F0726_02387 [Acidithiobacillus caldus]|nr:hypothetical protein F0726_02387 [Acidithiobacillus caldus]
MGTSINPKNQTTRHEETGRGSKMDFLSRFLILL